MKRRKIRVLLVEDNAEDVFLFRETLREASVAEFELLCADTLGRASEILRSERVALVISDLSLPNSSGLDTVRRIVREARQTPVIIMTASEDPSFEELALKEGALACWTKEKVLDPDLAEQIARLCPPGT